MNTSKLDLSIIIPAYNEEKKIQKDIEEAALFFDTNKLNGEIIVSTDGVTDRTNEIVKQLQKKYKNLILLADIDKIGKGAAIKKGVNVAKGEIIMFADAGLCVPYDNAIRGMKLLKAGFDCAIGSRALKGSKIMKKQPLYRYFGSTMFKFLIHSLLQIPRDIKDTQCGFKLYKKHIAKRVFGELETSKMMFDIEIILRLKKYNYKIVSFPVEWKNDVDTKFNPIKGTLDNFKDLYEIKVTLGL
jgi:dolichyl-phosphate beta-glucosyltransferase